jgi:leucyl-tRNA synthetase
LGIQESLTFAPIIQIDPKEIEESTATYVLQVNGKLRGRFDLPKDKTEEDIILKYAVSDYAKKPSTFVKRSNTKKTKK